MGHYDLAIAGAGPVGALAALLAAEQGFQVLLLDAAAEPVMQPPDGAYDLRVVALAPGSQAQFARLGAWPDALRDRTQPYAAMQVWDASGDGRIAFDAGELGLESLGHIVEVPLLQWALDQAVRRAELPGSITRWQGARYAFSEPVRVGLELRCADGRGASACMLIGADGRDSRVRKRAGIPVERRDYAQSGVVAVLRPGEPHGGVARQAFTPDGPLGLLPLANGQISIVWSVSQDRAQTLMQVPPEDFCRQVAAAAGQSDLELVSQRAAFPLLLQHAGSYSADAVALIGDAAHAVHPLAGLGMNLGIEDALALFAELSDWRPGQDPLPVLDRYARRRRRAVLPAIALLDGIDALFGSRDGEMLRLRDWGLNLVDRRQRLKREFMRYALGSAAPGSESGGQPSPGGGRDPV